LLATATCGAEDGTAYRARTPDPLVSRLRLRYDTISIDSAEPPI
jgi:hypothetical protein